MLKRSLRVDSYSIVLSFAVHSICLTHLYKVVSSSTHPLFERDEELNEVSMDHAITDYQWVPINRNLQTFDRIPSGI